MIELFRKEKVFFVVLILVPAVVAGFVATFYYYAYSQASATYRSKDSGKQREVYRRPSYAEGEILIRFKPNITVSRVRGRARLRVGEEAKVKEIDVAQFSQAFKQALKEVKADKISLISEFRKTEKTRQRYLRRGVQKLPFPGFYKSGALYKLTFSKSIPVDKVVEKFSRLPEVEYAEPNYIYRLNFAPNDPYYQDKYPDNTQYRDPNWNPSFDYQWNLKTIGMEKAWDEIQRASPSKKIKVAVIDSGVDFSHVELGGCSVEVYLEDECSKVAKGYDFVEEDEVPQDTLGHGTFVAGIIAAITNNREGIAGIDLGERVRIVPLRVFGSEGTTTVSEIIRAIEWAVRDQVEVVNMSLGSPQFSLALKEAVDIAEERGIVLVAAAGNSSSDIKLYPAGYDNVIAVGSVNYQKKLSWFSNFGHWVDLVAPGEDVLSLKSEMWRCGGECAQGIVGKRYYRGSGTSFSAPHVAAVAAFIKMIRPAADGELIRRILRAAAKDLGVEGFDETYAAGLLQVDKVVEMARRRINPPIARLVNKNLSVVPRKGKFLVRGYAYGEGFIRYEVLIRKKEEKEWTTQGVKLIGEGRGKVYGGELAEINLGELEEGKEYYIKLKVISRTSVSEDLAQLIVDSDIKAGFPISLKDAAGIVWTSPLAADLEGDGVKEIIAVYNFLSFSGRTGIKVVAFSPVGKVKPGFPVEIVGDKFTWYSTPAVSDLDGDGKKEIVIAGKYLLAIVSSQGKLIKKFSTGARYASPLVGYFTSSNEKQILIYNHDKGIFEIYNLNRMIIKQKVIKPSGINDVAAFDFDGDGKEEIVAFKGDDEIAVVEFNQEERKFEIASSFSIVDQTSTSCEPTLFYPVVSDLDNDGRYEIVAQCSEITFGKGEFISAKIWVLDYDPLKKKLFLKWKWGKQLEINGQLLAFGGSGSPLAVADIVKNSPGKELLFLYFGFPARPSPNARPSSIVINVPSTYFLFVLSSRGQLLWVKNIGEYFRLSTSSQSRQGVLIDNLFGNLEKEILITAPENAYGSCDKGGLTVVNKNGRLVPGWPKEYFSGIVANPVIADIDNDGLSEILATTCEGKLYVFETKGAFLQEWDKRLGTLENKAVYYEEAERCVRVGAEKDAFVAKGFPDKNFGSLKYLQIAGNDWVRTYIGFPTWVDRREEGMELSKAKLYLSLFGGEISLPMRIYAVKESWRENEINWRNKPRLEVGEVDETKIIGRNKLEIDVLPLVQKWERGKERSFGLVGKREGRILLLSKEGGEIGSLPELEVCWRRSVGGGSVPSPTFTPSATPIPSLTPSPSPVEEVRRCEETFVTEDAYIVSGNPTANFGRRGYLQVAEKGKVMSLLKFGNWQDRGGEGLRVDEATLTVYSFGGTGGYKLGAYGAVGDWQERRVNWQNRPRIGIKGGEAVFEGTGALEFDITSIVRYWQQGGDKSLILKGENNLPGWTYVNLHSKEREGGRFKAKIRICWVKREGNMPIATPIPSPTLTFTPTPTPLVSGGFNFISSPACQVVKRKGNKVDVVVTFRVTQPAPSYAIYLIQKGKTQRFNKFSNEDNVGVWLSNISKGWYTLRVEAWRKGKLLKKTSSTCGIF